MKRLRFFGIWTILALVMGACAQGAPATLLTSGMDGTPTGLPATTRIGASQTVPALNPTPTSTDELLSNPLSATRADSSLNVLTLPSQAPVISASATPSAIHPDRAEKIELLASLETSTLGIIRDVVWRPGTQNLLIQSVHNLFLIDLKSGKIIWSMPSGYNQLIFNPDGSELIALRGSELQRFDPASGQMLSSQEFAAPDGLYALSPDGRFIASTLGGDITLLELQTNQSLSLPADLNSGPIYDLAFSTDGQWILAGSQNGDLQAWEAHSGQRILFRPAAIPSLLYECQVGGARDNQASGVLVIVCSYPAENSQTITYQVGIYQASANAVGNKLVIRDNELRDDNSFIGNADRSRLAVVAGNDIELWSTSSGSRVRVLKDAAGLGMAFNPKVTNQLAIWSRRAIEIWDAHTGQKVNEWLIPGAVEPLVDLAFSPAPGPRMLVLARESGLLERWDLVTLRKTAEWKGWAITALAFTADGTNLAVGQKSGVVTLFNMTAADLVPQAEFQVGFAVNALAFAPRNPARLYVAGKSHHVHLWDVSLQSEYGTLQGSNLFELTVLDLRGSTLAAGTEPGRIVLWQDTPGVNPFAELSFSDISPILSLSVSPDGYQVIFTQGNNLKVWDIRTKKRVRETFFRNAGPVIARHAPDGCSLAIRTRNAVELLDSVTFESFSHLESLSGLTGALAFSSDGLLLASGTEEGGLLLWGVTGALQSDNGMPPALLCRSIPPPAPTPTASITPRPSATLTLTATPLVTATLTPTPPPFNRTLLLTNPPMRGDDVLLLQQRLLELGYTEVGMPDGIFGKMTDAAVRHFQQNNSLEMDGIVGPITWQVLFNSSAR